MRAWRVEEAKARFSEMLNACASEGPQLVTKRGAEAAVLVPVEEWHRLQEQRRPTVKEVLMAEHPRFELEIPPRGRFKHRKPPVF
jgi:prevent-host-death family protein